MAYDGTVVADLDVTKPDGSIEYPSILDDALREVKRVLKNDVGARINILSQLSASLSSPSAYFSSLSWTNGPSVSVGPGVWLILAHGIIEGASNYNMARILSGTSTTLAAAWSEGTVSLTLFGVITTTESATTIVLQGSFSGPGFSRFSSGIIGPGGAVFGPTTQIAAIKIG